MGTKVVCILWLLCPLVQASVIDARKGTQERMDLVSKALLLVLKQAVPSRSTTLYVHVHVSSNTSLGPLQDLLTHILSALPAQPRHLTYQKRLKFRPHVHVLLLLVEDLPALFRAYAGHGATGNLSHTLIFILRPMDVHHGDVQAALQLLWQLSVVNVAVVLGSSDQELLMATYFPFDLEHGCQVIRAKVINRFDATRGSWKNRIFYPRKLFNLHGCSLICATWPDMPYLVRETDGSFVGIEGELLQFLAQNLNFSLGVYWMDKAQVLATFNESGWIFEKIFNGLADYSLGGFHHKPANLEAAAADAVPYSQSTYYFMSHIMLVTNLPGAYSAYEKLAFPFRPMLWWCIVLVLMLGCFIVLLVHLSARTRHFLLGPHNQTPFYNLFVIAAGASLPVRPLPRRNFARFLLILWLLATFILRSAYQSGMYQLLRDNQLRNPPRTIAAVLAQQYTIQLTPENTRFLSSLPELPPQQLHNLTGSELQSFSGLAASSGTEKRLAIITPYEYFGYFRKLNSLSRRLHVVPERIFTQQLSFYVRRRSHLVGMFDNQIRRAHEHGFMQHWTDKYVSAVDEPDDSVTHMVAKAYHDNLHDDAFSSNITTSSSIPTTHNVLAFRELEAIFWLLLWAHLCSALIFGLELLRNAREHHKIFTCTTKMLP
ncbi:uncharacterized protein LOC115627656 [Scaptodrosophila lebanonensis]|uniref:Uncharacterized protein LOC115627656 n=1 Tax=Drosophila lebanonensis TaxID=7225 RepID=A0A6J2TWJ2_DROLE|nr:uncharacterized protein LOC115627656 [Scaptodrosophila lebanonensis]